MSRKAATVSLIEPAIHPSLFFVELLVWCVIQMYHEQRQGRLLQMVADTADRSQLLLAGNCDTDETATLAERFWRKYNSGKTMSLRITSHCDVLKPCPTPVQCRMQMECCRGAKLPIPLFVVKLVSRWSVISSFLQRRSQLWAAPW